jgi:alpha,alpha-trehalose phosphorylase
VAVTGDREFEEGPGCELLVETARLFRSLGHFDPEGCFRIDGVTGPDEYTALVDNNVFTNLMAARNLRTAADVAARYPDRATALGVGAGEIGAWLQAANHMRIPYDDELGVTAQSEGFTRYRRWDFDATPDDAYPLLLHYPYYLLYSSQVIKQADLVLAIYLVPDAFTPEQRCRDFEFYDAITVRDSSLSASIQAIVAAEVGHLQLALEYLRETAYVDLRDLTGNTHNGLHLAALSGTALAIVAGFGGMRDHGKTLAFAPRLPATIPRLRFRLLYQGCRLQVEIDEDATCYELLSGEELDLIHHGQPVALRMGAPQRLPWPKPPERMPVRPPVGRETGRPGVGQEGAGDAGSRAPVAMPERDSRPMWVNASLFS